MTWMVNTFFKYWGAIEEKADPRVHDWFLMDSPIMPIGIIVFYLYFVTKLGPRLMKDRSPMKIDNLVIAYNAVQIALSAYVVKEACRVLWFGFDNNFLCIDIDYSNTPLGIQRARTVWVYFMAKFLDLLDTVFFVLRKKQSQVTFLHVYHHTLVFTFGWYVTKFYPGGHVAFFGTVNAFVHMIMYSYYLITALHLLKNKSLWWKKYITQLQLLQFIVTGIHAVTALFYGDCNFPKFLIAIGVPQDVLMFMLFWDFYKKTYIQKAGETHLSTAKSNGAATDTKKVL